jgi:hypothetical protein
MSVGGDQVAAGVAPPAIWLLADTIMNAKGGGFRQQRWCEYFLQRGERVRIFHCAGLFELRWQDLNSIEQLRELRRAWLADTVPQAGVRDTRWARGARLIKHTLLVDLYYPSVWRLLFTLGGMLRATPHRVALLCSSPTFAMAVVGRLMKAWRPHQVIMALDMRDLWSLHTAFRGPKAHKRRLERWVIGGADIFTTVSTGLVRRFRQVFNAVPYVVYNVATQVPVGPSNDSAETDWSAVAPELRPDSLKILYTGSLPEGFYDLDGFLDGLETLAATNPRCAAKLQFLFIGATGELRALSAKRSLPAGLLVYRTQMSHERVGQLQLAADALLFLGYQADDNQGQVSIKLFEYFRRKRPILPVHITPSSDVHHLISLYCGRCPNVETPSQFARILSAIVEGKGRLPVACNEDADAELLGAYEATVSRVLAALGRHA